MRATKISTIVVSIIGLLSTAAISQDPKHRNRVAVIDTGLDIKSDYYKPFLCPEGHKDFTGTGIKDTDGHGTEIVNLIVTNSHTSNFCLVIYKFYTIKKEGVSTEALYKALKQVAKEKISLVNLSLSGAGYIEREDNYFYDNRSITFVTAAGNDGVNLDKSPRYPASYEYPNIMVVGALNKHSGEKEPISNYGKRVQYWEKAEATSYATAIKTGKIIKEKFGASDGLL